MIWLLLAVACASAFAGFMFGSTVGDLDDDESLVASFFSDLAVEQQEHAEERERADELAHVLKDVLWDGGGYGAIDRAYAALRAHDGARAHR